VGLLTSAVVLCATASAWASGTVVYVAGNGAAHTGADAGNCQTETSPCATISYALAQGGSAPVVAVAGTLHEDSIAISADATIEPDPSDVTHPPTIQEGSGHQNSLFVVSGSASATFRGLTFLDGDSSTTGGAITDTSAGTVSVAGDTFPYDVATGDGGAISVDNSSGELDVSDSVFEFDSTGQNSTTMVYGNGGSIADDAAALMTVRGSTFTTNDTGGDGGGVYVAGLQSTSIVGSTFVDNTSGGSSGPRTDTSSGNAVYASSGTVNLTANLFDDTCAIGASDTVGDPVDRGYNVALDESCIGAPAASDSVSPAAQDLYPLASNGSSSSAPQTMAVGVAGPAAGAITPGTSVLIGAWIGGSPATLDLCPVTDAAGVASSGNCNSGASQTTMARPVVYLAGTGAANAGGATNTTSCGLSYASPCGLLEKALLSSLVNYPAYADPYIDADGTVAETTSSITPTQPVTIQQDPGTQTDPATAAVIQGTGSNELLTIAYDGVVVSGLTFTAADPAILDDDTASADTATIDDVTFSANGTNSTPEGGAVDMHGPATMTISGSNFDGNAASQGGSLYVGNGGTVHVEDSSFSDDRAGTGGGVAVGTDGDGTLYVDGSIFSTETATGTGGGAIYLGSGAGNAGTAHITATIFAGDSAPSGYGGAIAAGFYGGDGDLHVSDSVFGADSANAGGAIASAVYAGSGFTAHATIEDSEFGNNLATANGGAIDNADLGGSGIMSISGSSFFDDRSTGGSPIAGDASGGAIDNGDKDGAANETSAGTLTVTGSTFYGNYFDSSSAAASGPAINEGTNGGDSATIAGDIFDAVASGDAPPSGTVAAPVCAGAFTDDGYNAGTDASCDGGSATGDQPASPTLDAQLAFSALMVSSVGAPAAQLYNDVQLPIVQPLFNSPLVGLIPTSAGTPLCPATDILGTAGPYGVATGCSSGAMQAYVPVAPAASAYPTDVTATSTSAGTADLSWTAPSLTAAGGEITGYTVTAHDLTTGVAGSPRTTAGISLSFSGLGSGDSYAFEIVTNNSVGSSGPATSNAVVIESTPTTTTTTTTPAATTTTTATTPTPTATTPTPTTPTPKAGVHTTTLDNQRLTLTTPALSGCLAPGKRWIVKISSSGVAHAKGTKLKFFDVLLTLGGKQAKTSHRSSSSVSFDTKGLKKGTYTLKAVFSYRATGAHGGRLVKKTITAKLSVC
jgi:hypothetical protein